MREIWANLPAQGQSLFPLLRSTSDLLMMPKDLLLEEGIRSDMCENVSGGAAEGGGPHSTSRSSWVRCGRPRAGAGDSLCTFAIRQTTCHAVCRCSCRRVELMLDCCSRFSWLNGYAARLLHWQIT